MKPIPHPASKWKKIDWNVKNLPMFTEYCVFIVRDIRLNVNQALGKQWNISLQVEQPSINKGNVSLQLWHVILDRHHGNLEILNTLFQFSGVVE